MVTAERARRESGHGSTRPESGADGRISPGPLPLAAGWPPRQLWCPAGTPPDAFDFLGARPTEHCWLVPCPACCRGWVPLEPDGTPYGYRLAVEVGCYPGCGANEAELAWWHMLRLGTLPPRPEVEPDERARRYALACVRRIWGDLPDPPTHAQLRRATFASGQWLEVGGLPDRLVAQAVVLAAQRALVDPQALAADLLAGRARPARLPGEGRP